MNRNCDVEVQPSTKRVSLDIENNGSSKVTWRILGEILGQLPSIPVEMGSSSPYWPWSRREPNALECCRRFSFILHRLRRYRGRNSKYEFYYLIIFGFEGVTGIMTVKVFFVCIFLFSLITYSSAYDSNVLINEYICITVNF